MFACAQIYRRFSTSQVNGCDVGSLRMVNCHVSWGQWLEFSYWISYPLFICGRNLIIFMWIQANIMKIDWKKCLWNIYVIDDIYGLSDKQIIATQVIVMIQYDMIYPLGNNFYQMSVNTIYYYWRWQKLDHFACMWGCLEKCIVYCVGVLAAVVERPRSLLLYF